MTGRAFVIAALLGAAIIQAPPAARAADSESCQTVRMSDPGWTDIASTNGLVGTLLNALGYEQKVMTLSVPITYDSLKNARVDAFLGGWLPAHASQLDPLKAAGQVEVISTNLSGARFTLAVPTEAATELGIKTMADLGAHADAFDRKIYGLDSGAAGNQSIRKMIEKGEFGLGGWELIESSEQAMLAQVDRLSRQDEAIVFLAWEPHPMNVKFDLTYLAGADQYFGARFGSSTVFTVARSGFSAECPNLARLLRQVAFTVPMENEVMVGILDSGESADDAASAWLKEHPEVTEAWLQGVTTADGKDGLAAVKEAIGF